MLHLRFALARLRCRIHCDRCSAGTHWLNPLPEDPGNHSWIPPGLRRSR